MTLNNKTIWMSVIGLALSLGSPALAQDPGSCLVQSTSRLDALLSPAKGSDEKFFTSGGGAPNVMLVLDTSCSMADWPQDWPSTKGCAHPAFTGLGFDPSFAYRSMVDNISGGTPSYNTNWFDPTKYYDAPTQGYGTNFGGSPSNTGNWGSALTACASSGIAGADSVACVTCLNTQGYYVHSSSVRKVWGKFLNFYAPRDSGAVLVLSQLIADIRTVRFGITVFGADNANRCWGGSQKICMFEEMGPKCGESFPLQNSAVWNNRNSILSSLKNKLAFGGGTPLASSIYAAGHYFKNQTGTDLFNGWFGAGYPTDVDFQEKTATDQKSICASCGFNAIIVVTDGEPTTEILTLPAAISGQAVTCVGGTCNNLNMARVAKWLWEHDLRDDYTGVQKVATYAIGFSQDVNSSGTLKTTAQYGGGKFYGATSTVALRDAVFSILDEVNSKNTSFSSAAIASVQSAGSTFAAILPRFSPQPSQPWVGSLRRFNLFNEFVEDYNLNPGEVQADLTLDADKSDIWLVDNTMPLGPYPPAVPLATARVVEDTDGQFVRWGTVTPATPYWEAGGKLVAMGHPNRKVYTVRDANLDGAFTSADTPGATQPPYEFIAANSLQLGEYLGIKGTSFCPSFAGALTCTGGPRNGLACLTALADCPTTSKCVGGTNNDLACTVAADCPGGTLECRGGPLDGQPCAIAGFDIACGNFLCTDNGNTECNNGPNDGAACTPATAAAICGPRRCQGVCIGGSDNGDNCLLAAQCGGGGVCSALGGAAGVCTAIPTTCTAVGAGAAGDMLTKWGLTINAAALELGVPIPTNQAEMDDLCVKGLIEFIRGRDMDDEDADGNRAETRVSVLGDIFHSSPAIVDPPVERFLCDIGLHNQCIRTLYSQSLGSTTPTPHDNPGGQTNCAGTAVTRDAYDAYQWMHRRRDKVILVGANDGMLHAFHDGNATVGACAAGVQTIDYPATDTVPSDPGTEVWAFIPPDLLPRLQEHVFGHAYFVDGDIMIRDIWEDKNADGRKTFNEFHTLAVIADGRGGTHYTALEVRFTNDPSAAAGVPVSDLTLGETAYNIAAPGFRWMFPQPGSNEASLFGKTLLSLSPKPPPIGPVLMERNSILTNKPSAGTNRYACSDGTIPCDTSEQWVVMLGGGWSPTWEKGRGFYMVDAWNGKVNGREDNLLWKMEYDTGASGEQDDPRKEMRYSITAPVAMVDYGSNTRTQLDGFFDTATVGDVGGQLWLARFFKPGKVDSTTKLVTNWSGGRTFEMDKKGDPNADGNDRMVDRVWPFYYITSVGIQPDNDAMRIFTGTGNRYALLEPKAGVCRFDNPLACAKYQCDETKVEYKIEKNTIKLDKAQMKWDKDKFKGNNADQNVSTVAKGICGAAGDTLVTASVKNTIKGCDPQSGGKIDFGDVRETGVWCGKDTAGNFFCKRSDTNTAQLSDLPFEPKTSILTALETPGTGGLNRFYGVWAYGGPDATRKFEEDKTATGAWKTAKQFDGTRISDRTGANATAGDLINVTTTTCTTATSCSGPVAGANSKGWFYEYSTLENRTASGSALLASCVLWNSVFPATAATTCGLAAVATGRFHQANFVTGEPNCAAGFKDSAGNFVRSLDRGVQAPPPEPATAIQISKTGQIRYSALLVEPGSKQATEANVTSGSDVLQSVYEIPVSRAMHKCRHVAGGSGNCVEAPP